jgi:hypothetical protein
VWYCEKPFIDSLPDFLKATLSSDNPFAKKMVKDIISEWHWKPQFWQRPFGMEFWLRRWIHSERARFQAALDSERKKESIRAKLESKINGGL